MNLRQFWEMILVDNSWLVIEHYVSLAGGEGLNQTNLEKLLMNLYNYNGTFEEFLTEKIDASLTRDNLLAHAQSRGYRTEEDFIKYCIAEVYIQNNGTELDFTIECINGEQTLTKTTDVDNPYAEFTIYESGTYTVKAIASNEKTAQKEVVVFETVKHSELIVPTIAATGNFANNPNIAEVREGNVPIPTGYTYVKGDVKGGVVIKDSSGNEWVWVPAKVAEISEVVNGENVGKLYDFTDTGVTAKTYPTTLNSGYREPDVVTDASSGTDSTTGDEYDAAELSIVLEGEYANTQTAASFKAQLQNEFDNMIDSVSKYGGYYIGRYEAGGSTNSPVVQQGAEVMRYISYIASANISWHDMYTSAKKLAANESVTTGIIWGCQWDNTLRWLVSSNNLTWKDLIDSREWGNYRNSQGKASENSGKGRTAGYSEYWKSGNIYDLAGNYNEWTLEAYSTNRRVYRGGQKGGSSPASSRNDFYPSKLVVETTTFRPTLIIE